MITILTKSANYDTENIKFFHNLHIFALEINYFPILLSVRALLARPPKRNKCKVVSVSRVTTHLKIVLINPGYLLTLLLGLPWQ